VAEHCRTAVLRRLVPAAVTALALAIPAAGLASTTTVNSAATRAANTAAARAASATTKAAKGLSVLAGTTKRATTAKKTKPAPKPAPKPAVPLSGWLANGTTFPDRALVLSGPSDLTAGRLHVSENGTAVSSFTLASTARPGAGDVGVMLVIDQSSSMAGAPLAAAMTAARAFAAKRTADQELGLITFSHSASMILGLTDDPASISKVLGATPTTSSGADVPIATQLALTQLAQAKVALGAIVVVSDGVGALTSSAGPPPASVQAAAATAHVPMFTVGLEDQRSSAVTLRALAAATPGAQFVSSTPAALASTLQTISTALTHGYVLRYRSVVHLGQPVTVTATADGVPGTLDISYRTPTPPRAAAPSVAKRPAAVRGHRVAGPDFADTTLLSPLPSFATGNGSPAAPVQNTSFLASSGAIPMIAGICGVLIAAALMLALYRPKRGVRNRVKVFIPGPDSIVDDDSLQSQHQARGVGRLLERGTWWAPFAENVEIARSPHTPIYLVKRAAIIGLVLAVVVTIVSGSLILGILPLLLWPIPLRQLVGRAARKQRTAFAEALPGYLQDLASALRVGRSLTSGLAIIAGNADEPVRTELERAVTDESLGRPLEASLAAVARRMHSTEIEQVSLVAALNSRSGSNVAEALDRVADGARDRADMRREVKALTAQGKMSSSVLTGLPPVMLLMITVISPSYSRPLFHTTIGIVLLVISTLMVFAGWKIMQKISTVKA
jgi:tight adherence protein B